jgi:multisubunit Na+/H+ antiporter MnhB subunit
VNLPITAVSIGLIIVGLKEEKVERHTPKLDLLGGAALLLSLLLMFYALAHSAHDRQPFNTELLLLLALSLVILVVFISSNGARGTHHPRPFSFKALSDFHNGLDLGSHGVLAPSAICRSTFKACLA